MQPTLSLLERALALHNAQEWARRLSLSKNAIYEARKSGHLTPVVAGNLAIELGEDPQEWITAAVIEGEKDSPAKARLATRLERWRKRWLSIIGGMKTQAGVRGRRSA